MDPIKQRKIALRKEVTSVVDSLSEEEILRQSKIVTNKILNNPIYRQAKSVSVYLSFEKEVRTNDLLIDIFASGKTCYIPRFKKGSSEMDMIKLHSLEDYNNLPVNKWNIKQPPDEETRESVFDNGELDVVLAPGCAFTKDGKRLGRGKGYYDKFLTKCYNQLKHKPTVLALAFKEQILTEIPVTDRDVIIDYVLFAEN